MITDEDINSPIISYLLSMCSKDDGQAQCKKYYREVDKCLVDTNTSADDKKAKDCPQQMVTYIRWRNTTCPYME